MPNAKLYAMIEFLVMYQISAQRSRLITVNEINVASAVAGIRPAIPLIR